MIIRLWLFLVAQSATARGNDVKVLADRQPPTGGESVRLVNNHLSSARRQPRSRSLHPRRSPVHTNPRTSLANPLALCVPSEHVS